MSETRWLTPSEERLWRSWVRLHAEMSTALHQQLTTDSGLSAADYAVLVPLSEASGGVLRSRELREEIAWDRDRLSHQVRRMEKRGLVSREDCPDDARASMVRITDDGRAAIAAAAPGHLAATRRAFFDHLSDDEQATLNDVCERLLANLAEPSD
ncbi:MAG: winged helix-turn-helix transcriptional regulator [Microthrixaceae bacterium]|nr:winged helix-turn-helix transcriptional regulator [Microthrixaceae bacterium]